MIDASCPQFYSAAVAKEKLLRRHRTGRVDVQRAAGRLPGARLGGRVIDIDVGAVAPCW